MRQLRHGHPGPIPAEGETPLLFSQASKTWLDLMDRQTMCIFTFIFLFFKDERKTFFLSNINKMPEIVKCVVRL